MAKINLNKLAKTVAEEEGGFEEINIAQIKEVMNILIWELANNFKISEVVELLERFEEDY